jgi:hypothetical protein
MAPSTIRRGRQTKERRQKLNPGFAKPESSDTFDAIPHRQHAQGHTFATLAQKSCKQRVVQRRGLMHTTHTTSMPHSLVVDVFASFIPAASLAKHLVAR